MTKDQIESGRMLAARLTHPPGAVILAAQFLRLLDEREALLEALKHATDAIAGEWGDSSAEDLRAAIAKAESP